jgi:radical SAM superfamily enzyme YgiQ (UPF0313 family)
MPSRILLISTNTCRAPDAVFPLGAAYVAAALRHAGYHVRVLDMLASPEPLQQALEQSRPDVVGISLRNIDDVLIRKRETFFGSLRELCSAIRAQADCKLVLGGSGFSIFPAELLELSSADYGIAGEGEDSLVALLEGLEHGNDISSIPGLVYRAGEQVICNPPVNSSRDGNSFSPGCDELVPYYVQNGGMLNVQTQRGCAHHCCYCTYPVIEGHRHRPRSADRVADEFERAGQAGARYIFLVDSIFNSSPGHVRTVCETLISRGNKLPWGCFLRPQGLTADLVDLMKTAGLAHAEFGSDSFSDRVLQAYDKRLWFSDILRSSELAHAAGLDYCHFLVCGGPGESMETLQETFALSQKLPGAVIMATIGMRIYPGTALANRLAAEGRDVAPRELLQPNYYLAPSLEADRVYAALKDFSKQNPGWITGDATPEYTRLVDRLRKRGVVGPLWSYVAMIQRLWPQQHFQMPLN